MPEGHTTHRVARDHKRWYAGQALKVSSPQGRFRAGARKLNELELEKVEAFGKHLFYYWNGGAILHIHLGLYGRFHQHHAPPPKPRGAVRLRVIGDQYAFDLNGPNTCELLTPQQRDNVTDRLGPDPLRRGADRDLAWEAIRNSRAAIGTLLLDQSIIAGIGNVFRAEVLHIHRIHPDRRGNQILRTEFDAIWQSLTDLLKIGVKYDRIITADPAAIGKTLGRMQGSERLRVYKHETCGGCGNAIETWELGARKIYACTVCQE
jgi:endonuclease-8